VRVPHLVVDAMNVIGSRPDGWWRDRDGAVRRLVARLQALAREGSDAVTVVVDGRPLPDLSEGVHDGVEVLYARRAGRDAADDRIVELVRDLPVADDPCVVTSDRDLARRVRASGAAVLGAGSFLVRLG
jgi:predicted RNA-binding protein with PIN domain